MIIVLDENLPPRLAHGLALIEPAVAAGEIEIHHVTDLFPVGTADEVWLPEVGALDAVVLTLDLDIRRVQSQWQICIENDIGVFFFRPPKGTNYLYWELVEKVIKHWPQIMDLAESTARPFGFLLKPRSPEPEPMPL